MPAGMSIRASLIGVATGFFPIGWIVFNVVFLYRLRCGLPFLSRA
jgi:lactate permease